MSGLFSENVHLADEIARYWFIPGGDEDDVRQEALIALYAASLDYRASAGIPFTAFAKMVIRRRLASAVRSATAGKHQVLTGSQRVVRLGHGELAEAHVLAPDPLGDAHDRAERRQHVRDVIDCVNRVLTPLERECIISVANGGHVTTKRIDNALARARRRLAAA